MVNDILDFSRLEEPGINIEKCLCDIPPILEMSVNSMKVIAEEKQVTFSVITEPDLPQVYVNAESIERAVKNLLSNSIKYSHKGGRIKLRAEIDRTGDYLWLLLKITALASPKSIWTRYLNDSIGWKTRFTL